MKSHLQERLSQSYRTRALLCEKRKNESYISAIQQEWEEMAIEWHLLAGMASGRPSDIAITS